MTSVPPGFYPDPAPEQYPGAPPLLRWWDGQVWTSRTELAGQSPVAPPQYGGQYGAQYGGQHGAQYGAQYGTPYATDRDTTPDGQRLSGWWRRVGAYLLDGVITAVITLLLGFPFVKQIYDYFINLVEEVNRQLDFGVENPVLPTQSDIYSALSEPLLALTILGLMVSCAYHCGFLRWKAATPGKLALGIRVRLRESDGPLAWPTILKRWAGQFGIGILGLLPIISFLGSIYQFLDLLWPLWDGKRQALHDKIAATNVVHK